MCDAKRVLLPVLIELALLPAALAGQQREPDHALLRHRLDSLIVEHERADSAFARQVALERQRRFASEEAVLDTQRVGVLTLISARDDAAKAYAAASEALKEYGALASEPTSPLAEVTLLFEHGRRLAVFDQMARDRNTFRVWAPGWADGRWRRRVVGQELDRHLAARLPSDLREWLGQRRASFDLSRTVRERIYRTMVSSPSPAVQQCRSGDLGACERALGLADPGPMWSGWYDERQLDAWMRGQGPGYAHQTDRNACYVQRAPDACARLAAEGIGPPPPFVRQVRESVVAHALELGGPSGYQRVLADTTGPVSRQLGRVAGTSPDSLLMSWRRTILDARPELTAGLGGSWLATLFWVVAISALAMRSSRWRLG